MILLTSLPEPPNPDRHDYKADPQAYNRAVYEWLLQARSNLLEASKQNDSPLAVPFVVSSYTISTTLTGASPAADIANFVCTLIDAFSAQGRIKQKS